jgi:hypothetical protein
MGALVQDRLADWTVGRNIRLDSGLVDSQAKSSPRGWCQMAAS